MIAPIEMLALVMEGELSEWAIEVENPSRHDHARWNECADRWTLVFRDEHRRSMEGHRLPALPFRAEREHRPTYVDQEHKRHGAPCDQQRDIEARRKAVGLATR